MNTNTLTLAKLKKAIENFEKDFETNGINPAEVPVMLVTYHPTTATEVKYTIGQAGITLVIC